MAIYMLIKKSVLYRKLKDQFLPHFLISPPKMRIADPLFLAFTKAIGRET